MALICPQFSLTFFAADYPAEAGAVSLLGADDWVSDSEALNGAVSQIVNEQEGFRWATPNFWPQGNQRTALEWTRVIADVPNDGTAIALALEAAAELPVSPGWVRLELPNLNRAWAIAPAAVRSIDWRHDPLRNELHLRYAILKGIANEVATSSEEGAITTEIGTEILTEDGGYYLALESMP